MIKEIMKIVNRLLYNNTSSIDVYSLYANILEAIKESIKVLFKEDKMLYNLIQRYLNIKYENENDFYDYISYNHLSQFPLYSSFLLNKKENNNINTDSKLDMDILKCLTDEQISIFLLCNHLSMNGIYLLLNDYLIFVDNLEKISKDDLIWYCVYEIPKQRKRISEKGNGLLLQFPFNILKRLNSDVNISYSLYDDDYMLLSGRLTEYFQRYNSNNKDEENYRIIEEIDPILVKNHKDKNRNNNNINYTNKYEIESITEGVLSNISSSHVTYEYKVYCNDLEWYLYKRYNSFYVFIYLLLYI